LLLLLLGAGLVIFSAQRTYDYSKLSGMFAIFAGILMMLGAVMAGSMNIAYGGVFVIIFGAIWLGMRDRYAQ
jgi:drug/metabolite transporter superfamily protein YnfA